MLENIHSKYQKTAHIILIIDNKQPLFGFTRVKVYVYGILPEINSGANSIEQQKAIENLKTFKKVMEDFYQLTKKFFIFPDFRIEVRYCGFENAFSDPNITMCKELIESLVDQGLEKAVVFILFHELGHTLLRLWNYPLWNNEDVADEFATVIMLLSNQETIAFDAAQWFASRTSVQEAMDKLRADDRHTLSPQRARNIINWLNQSDELMRRWQKIFVPNMQTETLKSIDKDIKTPWIDHKLIRAELAKRG